MKTFNKILVLGGVFLFLLSPLISSKLKAQSRYDENQVTDNIVVKSINPERDNHPDKLILIFDSTGLIFEFTDNGELSSISTSQVLYSNSLGGGSTYCATSKQMLSEQYIQSLMNKAVTEKTDEEEDMELQEWMMNPKDWVIN